MSGCRRSYLDSHQSLYFPALNDWDSMTLMSFISEVPQEWAYFETVSTRMSRALPKHAFEQSYVDGWMVVESLPIGF